MSNRLTSVAALLLLTSCGGGDSTAPPVVATVEILGAPAGPVLVGTTVRLDATAHDDRGRAIAVPIEWSTVDASRATVDATGLVTGVAAGTARVVASSQSKSDTVSLDFRVGAAIGVDGGSIALLGGSVRLDVPAGALAQSTVIMVAPASTAPADPRLVPSSAYELSPPEVSFLQPATLVVRYDPARLAGALDEPTLLLASLGGTAWSPVPGSVVDVTTHTVRGIIAHGGTYGALAAAVDHIVLSGAPTSGRIYVGQSAQLAVAAYDAAGHPLAGRATAFTSSDQNVLSVSPAGRITALSVGTATITATCEGKSAAVVLEVRLVPVASITLAPSGMTLYAGQKRTLAATLHDSVGGTITGRTVSWSSSDESKATVDAQGAVTAIAAGEATVTASVGSVSAEARVSVLPRVTADWSAAAEWTTFQGNARHDGFVDAALDPVVFGEMWSRIVYSGAVLNPVTAGEGKVFVSNNSYFADQRLSVLDAQTGATTWSYVFGTIHSVDPPAYADGVVFVQTGGHEDSFLWGFEAATGVIRLRSSYGNQWSRWMAPTIVGQTVYVAGGYYGGMYAFSATDGTQRWFATLNQYDLFTPAVHDGLVFAYTGSYDPKLSVVDATTGTLAYEIKDPHFSWDGWTMGVAPAVGASNDVLATQGGRLLRFDLAARSIAYEITSGFVGNVTVADGVAYVVRTGQVEARRESDGTLLWVWVPPESQVSGTLIATRNLLFASTAGNVYAIDLATHRTVWTYPRGGQLALSSQGILFIAGADSRLTAIRVR